MTIPQSQTLGPKAKAGATLAILALATRLPMVPFPFVNVDEAAHFVGARELVGSGQLYQTFVDNKPPLIYFIYALSGESMIVLRLLAIALLWLPLAALAGRTAEMAAGPSEGGARLKVGALYLVTAAGFVAADTHAINTELVGLLPTALAAWLCLRSSRPLTLLLVGGLVGIAGLAKQPFLAFLLAPALSVARASPDRVTATRRLILLAFGAACPLLLTSIVFHLRGAHDDYLRWVWLFNLDHIQAPVALQDALLRFAKMGLPLLGASSALWVLAFWPQPKPPPEGAPRQAQALPTVAPRFFFWIGLIVTLLPAFLGWRLFGHYFLPAHYFLIQLAAPAFLRSRLPSLAGTRMPARSKTRGRTKPQAPPRWLTGLALAPGIVFSLLNPWLYAPGRGVAPVTAPQLRAVGQNIAHSACPGPVFVWGYAPQIYAFAERRPASRYVVPIEPITGFVSGNEAFERGDLAQDFHVSQRARRELLDDLERSRPAYVVDLSSTELEHWDRFPLASFPALAAFVEAGYRKVDSPDHSISVYERRSCPEGDGETSDLRQESARAKADPSRTSHKQ